jgi:Fanconi anemia group M protein
MEKLKLQIENFIEQHSFKLKELGLTKKSKINRYDAIQLQNRLLKILKQKKGYAFQAIVHIAAINKAYHALALLETQGLEALQNYLTRMGEKPKLAKSEKVLLESLEFKGVMNELKKENLEHPKIQKLLEILHENFSKNKKSRVIVFCQYRDTVGFLESILDKNKTIKAKAFIGQATKGKLKGMSQEEQKEIISDFKSGKYNVLLATSVAEEGIDIPEVDLVVFYEPVPSEIRTIQRKGRTARKFKGKVIMLITQKTLDERSYYSAGRKEKKMKESIEKVKKKISMLGLQRKLFEY